MIKTNSIVSEAAQSAATAILTSAACTVAEAIQYILMYIADNENRHPAAASYMQEVLDSLCSQIDETVVVF